MTTINLTAALLVDASYWSSLTIDPNSTVDATGLGSNYNVTITATGISVLDTSTGTVYSYSGAFNNVYSYLGNNGDSDISGAVGISAGGYVGGSGNDTFVDSGSTGGQLSGGDGDDVITGGTGSNNISGGDGNDTLHSGADNDNLTGGDDDDELHGNGFNGNLHGGDGNDVIYKGDGANDVKGGDGNDTLYGVGGTGGSNNVSMGADDDVIHVLATDTNIGFVNGNSGYDTLVLPPGYTAVPWSEGGVDGRVFYPDGSVAFGYGSIENVTVACFAKGTLIRTAHGELPIETLAEGDLIETLDHGLQPMSWIGSRTVRARGPFAPIVFQPGAIGNDRELLLSPQHRVLLRDWRAELHFGEPEVLIAAKHLVNGDTIYVSERDQITYYHILFKAHEIVISNGVLTESFYPGATALNGLEINARIELQKLFPELFEGENSRVPTARIFLKSHEASLLT